MLKLQAEGIAYAEAWGGEIALIVSVMGCFGGALYKKFAHSYSRYFIVFPGGSEGKASPCNAGDLGSLPGSGRSPGEGNGNPLQYSCLQNPMDGGAWWATVHGVAKSRTRLSDFTLLHIRTQP